MSRSNTQAGVWVVCLCLATLQCRPASDTADSGSTADDAETADTGSNDKKSGSSTSSGATTEDPGDSTVSSTAETDEGADHSAATVGSETVESGAQEGTELDSDDGGDDGDIRLDMFAIPDSIVPQSCPSVLALIRDFRRAHPDFEAFAGDQIFPGLVEERLDGAGKPVHAAPAATEQSSGPESFAQWFVDVAGVNQRFEHRLHLEETPGGDCVYDNPWFFPVDDRGFGNEGSIDQDGTPRNFFFTTEIRGEFIYFRGQHITLTGDDDFWLFFNGTLVMDLGGVHPPVERRLELDDLGLREGETLTLALFHANRSPRWSNFKIETNIDLIPGPTPH